MSKVLRTVLRRRPART